MNVPISAEMARVRSVLDPVPAESLDHPRGVVAGVVVHDDDLRVVSIRQLGHHPRQRLAEVVGAVVDRDDHRPPRPISGGHSGDMRGLRHPRSLLAVATMSVRLRRYLPGADAGHLRLAMIDRRRG